MEKKKVVLAFSGGLDTSFCVKYLSEDCGYDVYTAIANTGGFSKQELANIEARALALPTNTTTEASATWCLATSFETAPTRYR